MKIRDKEFVTYLSSDSIQKRVKELADQINSDYKQKDPLFIAILNGAFIFAADLIRNLEIPAEITFIKVASYEQLTSSGKVKDLVGLQEPVQDRNVVILEDIVDTGNTMKKILETLHKQKPESVEILTLLLKPDALQTELNMKYIGFEIPDKFVIGYGLDYDGLGRNFKDILQLKS